MTLDGTVNYFNLTGASLSTTPSELMAFTTNTLTTNQFGIIGFSQGTYGLSISNNALYITLTALAAPSGGTTTVTNSGTYPSASFGTNSLLNISQPANVTVTSGVTVSNNSGLLLNGTLTTPFLNVNQGSS